MDDHPKHDRTELVAEVERLREALREADAQILAAHIALDEGGAGSDRALALSDRIKAALPPLPIPAGKWYQWIFDPPGVWRRSLWGDEDAHQNDAQTWRIFAPIGLNNRCVHVSCFSNGDWRLFLPESLLTRDKVRERIAVLRLALGPDGDPPEGSRP